MIRRLGPSALLIVTLATACSSPIFFPPTPTPAERAAPSPTPDPLASFLQDLRQAVRQHDRQALRTLMAEDLSFSFGHQPDRDAALAYWDEHDLWPELERTVNGAWAPYLEGCIATPAEFVTQPEYFDYRAGACQAEDGRWSLIFFVAGD